MIHLETSIESDLWTELEAAALSPETADFSQLWQLAEAAISLVPKSLRLQVAGDVVLLIADVYAARSNSLLSSWERTQNGAGPPLTVEGLAEMLLRQSMRMDFSDLIEVPKHKYNRVEAEEPDGEEASKSIATPVDKAALLEVFDSEIELVETEAQAASAAVAVAEEEDVVGWAEAIAQWMRAHSSNRPISLIELQQGVGMTLVEVWLGLLLGIDDLELEQRGEFYDPQGIWLRQKCLFKAL